MDMRPAEKKRFLWVTSLFPPAQGGTPFNLGRILKHLPREQNIVFTDIPAPACEDDGVVRVTRRGSSRWWLRLARRLHVGEAFGFLQVPSIARQISRAVDEHNIDELIAVFPHDYFLLSSYLVHHIRGLPLSLLIYDVYARCRAKAVQNIIAGAMEERILRAAKTVYVLNPYIRDRYLKLYGTDAIVVPNTVDLQSFRAVPDGAPPFSKDGVRIVFTGDVYRAQEDAVLNMVHAANSMAAEGARFEIYTKASKFGLESRGIRGPGVSIGRVPPSEIPQLLKSADILFLPLAFGRKVRTVVETSTPAKMAEYVAAGRLILVHAPPYAGITKMARRQGWGLVVDEPQPEELVGAVRRLRSSPELRHNLVSGARVAVKEYDAKNVAAEFWQRLNPA